MKNPVSTLCLNLTDDFAGNTSDSLALWHGRGGESDDGPIDHAEERRILQMIRAGLGAAEVAWALERSIDVIEARLKLLSVRFGGEGGRPIAVADGAVQPDATEPSENQLPSCSAALPLNVSPLAQACLALDGRVEIVDGQTFLDEAPASIRDLVLAAAEDGVEIPYPGLHPLPAAFHGGPSSSGALEPTIRKSVR